MEVRQIYAVLDAEWRRETQEYEERTGQAFPCGPGCAECCKTMVENVPLPIGQSEVTALWDAMVSLPEEDQKEIIMRLFFGDPSTCVFLSQNDLCLVYDGRPFFCRIFGLSGETTCGRVPEYGRGARWVMAVNWAHAELRAEDDSLISVRSLVEGLSSWLGGKKRPPSAQWRVYSAELIGE